MCACVQNIDNALSAGDYQTLREITALTDFEALLSNEVESMYEQCACVQILLTLSWYNLV